MSQVPPKPIAEPKPDAPQPKGGGTLRVVLIVVMIVMLGLFAWDRYARATSQASFEKIEKWVDEGSQERTPADVQKLLGRRPDRGLEDKVDYALETYSWPRGILVQSYVLKVVYRKDGDKVLLHEAALNREPDDTDLPNPPVDSIASPAGGTDDSPSSESAGHEGATPASPGATE